MSEVTQILSGLESGDPSATEKLLPLLYDELRRLAAAKLSRVGKTPGSIKAMKAQGDNNTDVMISNDDAAAVRSAADNLKFLSECRVVLVID